MHDRDFIWQTAFGKKIKIRNMSSSHLVNTLNKINKETEKFEVMIGVNKTKETKKVIKQEIRLRKLNRLADNNNELF